MDVALSIGDRSALDRHLAECAPCRTKADRLSRAWRALDRLEGPVEAVDDWRRIEAAVDAEGERWTPPWAGWQLAPAPAASAWVLAGMVMLGAAGGALVSRAALPPSRTDSTEARAFAETLGVLPWESPAAALAAILGAPLPEEERP